MTWILLWLFFSLLINLNEEFHVEIKWIVLALEVSLCTSIECKQNWLWQINRRSHANVHCLIIAVRMNKRKHFSMCTHSFAITSDFHTIVPPFTFLLGDFIFLIRRIYWLFDFGGLIVGICLWFMFVNARFVIRIIVNGFIDPMWMRTKMRYVQLPMRLY